MCANVPEELQENSEWMFRWLIAAPLRGRLRASGNVFAISDRVVAALAAIVDRAEVALL